MTGLEERRANREGAPPRSPPRGDEPTTRRQKQEDDNAEMFLEILRMLRARERGGHQEDLAPVPTVPHVPGASLVLSKDSPTAVQVSPTIASNPPAHS
jgi:hypothetical protein